MLTSCDTWNAKIAVGVVWTRLLIKCLLISDCCWGEWLWFRMCFWFRLIPNVSVWTSHSHLNSSHSITHISHAHTLTHKPTNNTSRAKHWRRNLQTTVSRERTCQSSGTCSTLAINGAMKAFNSAYYTDLKALVGDCDFKDLEDEMLRDRIVCGIHDHGLREKLLQIESLSLQKCVDTCSITESSAQQMEQLRKNTDTEIHYVKERYMLEIHAGAPIAGTW